MLQYFELIFVTLFEFQIDWYCVQQPNHAGPDLHQLGPKAQYEFGDPLTQN